jgi:hypothetical protein
MAGGRQRMGGLTLLDPFGADLAGEDRGSCRGRVTERLRRLDGNGGDGGEWRGAAASGTGSQASGGERRLEGKSGDGGEPRGLGGGWAAGRRLGVGWVAAGQTLTLAAVSWERGDAGERRLRLGVPIQAGYIRDGSFS